MSSSLPPLFELDLPSAPRARDTFANKVKRVITSATLLIIAYIVVFLIHQYVLGALSLSLGFDPVITYNYVDNLPDDYRQWSLRKITIIFTSGPLVCLIIGIFSLDFFNSLTGVGSLARCFVLWFTICSLNLFLSFMLISPIAVENYSSNLYTGFSVVGAWWRLGRVIMIPLSFIALTGSMVVGFLTSNMFMKFSFSKKYLDTLAGKRKMLVQLYVLPILAASPILILLTTNQSFLVHVFHLANMLVMAIGMFMGVENLSRDSRVYGQDVLNTIPVFWLLIAGGLIALITFVLK